MYGLGSVLRPSGIGGFTGYAQTSLAGNNLPGAFPHRARTRFRDIRSFRGVLSIGLTALGSSRGLPLFEPSRPLANVNNCDPQAKHLQH